MLPAALALDRTGNIYVADAAAQRIRVIAPNGMVRTIAGSGSSIDHGLWVQGGYRDGRGAQAQFSSPSGIAIGPDGMIYVADTYNGRIRRVAQDGTVSTFAVLARPSALAFDRVGNLYVADRTLGMQRISPGGVISALPMSVSNPFGVAVWDRSPGPPVVVASDPQGLVYSVGGSGGVRLPTLSEAGRPIGTPFQLAMLDGDTAVFTDVRTNTVRYLHGDASVLVGGDAREDTYEGGGFRDGPMERSLFDAPMGIIALSDGSFLVADGGNRRIRRISGFDRRQIIDAFQLAELEAPPLQLVATPSPGPSPAPIRTTRAAPTTATATPTAAPAIPTAAPAAPTAVPAAPTAATFPLPPPRNGSRDFRVLYVGNSIIWWDTDWAHSIAGIVERTVDRALPAQGVPRVRVVPIRLQGASVTAMASYLEEIANTGLADAVILHLNDGTVAGGAEQSWVPPAVAALRRAHLAMRSSHVPLLIVANPIPLELGPTEDTWAKLLGDALVPQYLDREDGWRTVLASTDDSAINLWPAFYDELRSPAHRPIFSTDDAHLTDYGRELVGNAIAAELLRLHPWTAAARR